jgi:UDP-N-acetyl-D-galactosamine dehydrogenase
MSNLYDRIIKKEAKIGVIGLGYVGLPIALAFAKKVSVIGFDINESRVKMMQEGQDPSDELASEDFDNSDITFTANLEDLHDAEFFIIAVPTPIDDHNKPDLRPLIGSSTTVGKVLSKGDYVVY